MGSKRIGPFRILLVASALIASALVGTSASASELEIVLKSSTEREIATQEQLLRLLNEYNMERWLFTRKIIIEQRGRPHSHPVLTISTAHPRGDDSAFMAMFVHEQLHWLREPSLEHFQAAWAELAELYPDVPARDSGGARDQESTYLHLIVCMLEYQAMTELVGADRAYDTLAAKRHYEWIYDQVLNNGAPIKAVLERNGIALP